MLSIRKSEDADRMNLESKLQRARGDIAKKNDFSRNLNLLSLKK
jgi:hypothetical protein